MRMKGKKQTTCILLVLLLILGNCYSVFATETTTYVPENENAVLESVTDISEYENNEVLVKFKEETTPKEEDSLLKQLNVNEAEEVLDGYQVITADDTKSLNSLIEDLDASDEVEYVQPNYVYETNSITEPNDKNYKLQWGLHNDGSFSYYDSSLRKDVKATAGIDINIKPVWEAFAKEKPTGSAVVAVIDTGVDYNHEDLNANMWTNSLEIAADGVDNDGNGYIDDYYGWNFYNDIPYNDSKTFVKLNPYVNYEGSHGTHCAGTIAAVSDNNVGVAGISGNANVKVMSLKALGGISSDGRTSGTTATVIQAIKYAEKMGADICNLSFGGTGVDKALQQTMRDSSMLFVCAAGNDGKDGTSHPIYPAAFNLDNSISVANITCTGELAPSSNYGKTTVDIAAPGTRIASTVVKDQYAYETGTSMAAPMVAGVAGLIYASDNNMDAPTAKRKIVKSAKSLSTLKNKVRSGGMLDAQAALNYNAVAPTIKTTVKSKTNTYVKELNINVTASDDLQTIRYAKGTYTVADFLDNPNLGTKVSVADAKKKVLKVSVTTTYTIFAKNSLGNETVRVVKVTVKVPTSVTLNRKQITMKKGQTYTLKATVKPAGVVTKLTYKSSNTKVAAVTQAGKVTARGKGTATITVTTENGKKRTCKIIVK